MQLSLYYGEFITIALVHFLAVASPGPDFAVIVKQSLTRGRQTALYTSVGIGSGILLHVTYSLVGIGLLIASDPLYFTVLSYIAGLYLFYLGIQGLRAKPMSAGNKQDLAQHKPQSPGKAFLTGFLVNGLNIKATLFFVSLFSIVISPETPTLVQSVYGVYMALATAIWFSFLSYMMTMDNFRQKLLTKAHVIDRFMGVVLIALAIKLVLS
ncbi:lysine transporter LysE [Thalassotalea sp. 42_200_T64]|nr:lysine transporter LysE [Thalassotalea sp. 42_200_T64]